MVNYSPLRRVELRTATDGGGSKQKRCLKASTLFCKIEAFKLAGLVLPWTAKLRTATDWQWFHAETMFKSINTVL
ncbi:hypothetical protein [Treponema phagedenis]|uniref:hypothetical protein n=1 Tax=Treponema phagedenis TaxID=162 RepID=UPI0005CC589D|nr:hypothetical protein [Treponema phagedenis]